MYAYPSYGGVLQTQAFSPPVQYLPTYSAAEYAAREKEQEPVITSSTGEGDIADVALPMLGEQVISLVDQPKWSPVPLKKGDIGVVVGHNNGKCSIRFNGCAGMLPPKAFQVLSERTLRSTGIASVAGSMKSTYSAAASVRSVAVGPSLVSLSGTPNFLAGSVVGSVVGSVTGSLPPPTANSSKVGSLVPSLANASKVGSLVPSQVGSSYDAYSAGKYEIKTNVMDEAREPVPTADSPRMEGLASHVVEIPDNAVAEEVHAIHEKVSAFFGMIGGLFHTKPGIVKGPGGSKVGIGSTVEVTREDGSQARGHIVGDGGVNYTVQLHTDPPGKTIFVAAASVAHTKSYAPEVGAGVEVLYQGDWFVGYVVGVPTVSQSNPLYEVMCHGDNPDELTLADPQSIRPLLSPEEKEVVDGELGAIKAAKEKEAAKQKKAKESVQKRSDFKEKMDDIGLGEFYVTFTANGYDTEDSLEFVQDDELVSFGMKAGHVSKFHQAFPRGKDFVVSNYYLESSAAGIVYTWTKSMSSDTHKVADFGSVVRGTELPDGWLKVGSMYLPAIVDGKRVLFPKGSEPKDAPMEAFGAVENKAVSSIGSVESKSKAMDHFFGVERAVVTSKPTALPEPTARSNFADNLDSFAHLLRF